MVLNGSFDKETEKFIKFWQKELNCIILISEVDGFRYMDLMYLATGKIERDIPICKTGVDKHTFFIEARKHLRKRRTGA